MKTKVILYHANCEDGFSAAWAAWKKLGNKASYIPVDYQSLSPKGLEDKELYFVDFAYPLEITKRLIQKNISVTILDHHATSQNNLKSLTKKTTEKTIPLIRANKGYSNLRVIFKNSSSGAVIAWNYFHPKKKLPKLLEYVEDTDLWKFKKKNSKEIFATLKLISHNFKDWDAFARKVENPKTRKEIIKQGKIILEYEEKIIKRIVRRAEQVIIKGKKALAVNCPILASEIGNELSKGDIPIGIVWFEDQ
ncbi:MAG: hypothetical protein U1C56_00165, partial [Candidatus Curtissbacteria bacterium]|nr:hypothetical protein [Candidatus Curtissbacteria bacterium]